MKGIVCLLICCGYFQISQSQNIFKTIIINDKSKEPVIGATVIIRQLNKVASSDSNGKAIIKNIPDGKFTIEISNTGFKEVRKVFAFPAKSTDEFITIDMEPADEALDEVIVNSTRTNSRIKDIPVRVEVLGSEELNEEGNMRPSNIAMLLAEATGIQSQQTSGVNGNVSIRLQGLDGKYTQILKDGFPLYGGFAQGLSIMQIPPLDFKQVEIIKGSSSSLYGSDAIAGIINLISKQPTEKRELTVLLNQTTLSGSDVNAYFSQRWKKIGFSLLSTNNLQAAKDINKDGFSEMPKTTTFNLTPVLYFYLNPTTKIRFGVNGTFDKRKGGDMLVLKNKADNLHRFFEENISNRVSTQLEFNKEFAKEKTLTFKNSIAFFSRGITQNSSVFKGNQTSSFSEVAYTVKRAKHQIVIGLNINSEKFTEDSTKSHLKRDYNYFTTGIFVQDDWKLTDKFTIETGIRTDYQNQFDFFFLPRLALLYKISENFYVRVGSGLGYKIPTIFSTASEEEGINNIQPLSANIKAEKSVGGNLDFNYKKRLGDEITATFNQSFFITQINSPLVLQGINFENKRAPIITKGFETSVRLRWEALQIFAGYTFLDAKRRYDAVQNFVPLTPKGKIVTTISYEKEDNFSIGTEGFYTSTMYRDADTKTKEYFVFGIIAQKHFKHLSIIANCENIFDQRQTRFENIVIPPTSNPTFRQLYAPLDGRIFNVALRIKL